MRNREVATHCLTTWLQGHQVTYKSYYMERKVMNPLGHILIIYYIIIFVNSYLVILSE